MRDWQQAGVWDLIHFALLDCWSRQEQIEPVVDSGCVRAVYAGDQTGTNPTDRAKRGSKRHLICDKQGVPLAVRLTGANRNDSQEALALVDAIPRFKANAVDRAVFRPAAEDRVRARSFLRANRAPSICSSQWRTNAAMMSCTVMILFANPRDTSQRTTTLTASDPDRPRPDNTQGQPFEDCELIDAVFTKSPVQGSNGYAGLQGAKFAYAPWQRLVDVDGQAESLFREALRKLENAGPSWSSSIWTKTSCP